MLRISKHFSITTRLCIGVLVIVGSTLSVMTIVAISVASSSLQDALGAELKLLAVASTELLKQGIDQKWQELALQDPHSGNLAADSLPLPDSLRAILEQQEMETIERQVLVEPGSWNSWFVQQRAEHQTVSYYNLQPLIKRVELLAQKSSPRKFSSIIDINKKIALPSTTWNQKTTHRQSLNSQELTKRAKTNNAGWLPLLSTDPPLLAGYCRMAANNTHHYPSWAVVAVSPLSTILAPLTKLQQLLLITGGIMLLLGISASVFTARKITHSLQKMSIAAKEIGRGNWNVQMNISSRDEIGELARSFNKMVAEVSIRDRIQREEESHRHELQLQLRQTQKMETIGNLAAGVAHDFDNLLQVIRAYLRSAHERCSEDETMEELQLVELAADQAAGLTQSLLAFSKQLPDQKKPVELSAEIRKAEKLLRHMLPARIELQVECQYKKLWIYGDPVQLQQILLNLAVNAADAMPEGGILEILCGRNPADSECSRLVIRDHGKGIPAACLDRIFEPFYSRKESGSGTGLGLAIVHGVVGDHNGKIEVRSELEVGTTFVIDFPTITSPVAEVQEKPTVEMRADKNRVLLIESDRYIAGIIRQQIESLGYKISFSTTSEGIKDVVSKHKKRFALGVLSAEHLEQPAIQAATAGLALVVLGANTGASTYGDAHYYLQKPFTMEQLQQAIAEVQSAQEKV